MRTSQETNNAPGTSDPVAQERDRARPQTGRVSRFSDRLGFQHWALVPLLLFFIALVVYPVLTVLGLAFSEVTLAGGVFQTQFTGLANYHAMLADGVFRVAVTNTVVFVMVATAIQIVLGTVLAVLAERSRIFSGVARNVILWPAILAPVSISVIWWLILNIEFGLLNDVLNRVGLPTQAWLASSTWALPTVIAVDVWHWTPVVFLFALAGLASIDRSLYDAARVDGASEWGVFRHITLPLLMPTLGMAAVTRVILGFKVFDEIYVLTDGGPGVATEVISTYVREVFVDRLAFGYGAFLSLTVVTIVIVVLMSYPILASVVPQIVRRMR